MPSDSIIVAFDVTEDFRFGIGDRLETTPLDEFGFESGKETLHRD